MAISYNVTCVRLLNLSALPVSMLKRSREGVAGPMNFIHAALLVLPAPILITIGVVIALIVVIVFAASIAHRRQEERDRLARERAAALKRQDEQKARQKRQQLEERATTLAAAKRRLEEQARADDKRRVETLGKQGAALVTRAKASVQGIVSSEAAREGWLGDVDFTPDVEEIETNLSRAAALRRKSKELSALAKPNDDDRKIIAEATTETTRLELKTKKRVELLERCASEARLIDESLRTERDEIRLAAKREELHGELAAMLYQIEASGATPGESAAEAVIARVQAYREIKGQIERARGDAEDEPPNDTGEVSSVPWLVAPVREAWKWIVD